VSEESIAFKRQQREALLGRKQQELPSVLESFHIKFDTPASIAAEAAEKKAGVQKCPNCHGTGIVSGLFSKSECYLCDGTGFDLSDPVALVKHLLTGGRKLRLMFNAKKRELDDLVLLVGEDEISRLKDIKQGNEINSRFD